MLPLRHCGSYEPSVERRVPQDSGYTGQSELRPSTASIILCGLRIGMTLYYSALRIWLGSLFVVVVVIVVAVAFFMLTLSSLYAEY